MFIKVLLFELNYIRSWNIDCELITPEEIKRKCPMLKTDDLCGGLFIPGDGVADSLEICKSFTKSAKERGNVDICLLQTVL